MHEGTKVMISVPCVQMQLKFGSSFPLTDKKMAAISPLTVRSIAFGGGSRRLREWPRGTKIYTLKLKTREGNAGGTSSYAPTEDER
jgi:hypothetical protein